MISVMIRGLIVLALVAFVGGGLVAPVPARAEAPFVIVSGKKYHALEERAARAESAARRERDARLREHAAYEAALARWRDARRRLAQADAQIARLGAAERERSSRGHTARAPRPSKRSSSHAANRPQIAERRSPRTSSSSVRRRPAAVVAHASRPPQAPRPVFYGWGDP
jgi:hypothetical protein